MRAAPRHGEAAATARAARRRRRHPLHPAAAALAGKYQSFTEADLARLRAAGYAAPMRAIDEGVPRYVERLISGEPPPRSLWDAAERRACRATPRTAAHSQLSMEGLMKRLALALALALCSAAAFAAINLNTATKEELVALPGIGPAKAQAILDYRNTHGQFKSIEELKDVKGIGAKRFEKLKGELTVVGASAKPSARPADAIGAAANGQGHR